MLLFGCVSRSYIVPLSISFCRVSETGTEKAVRKVRHLISLCWINSHGSATKISASMSDGRTLLRMLKWLNEYKKYKDFVGKFVSAKDGSADSDPIMFLLGTLRTLGNAGYFVFDNMMWLGMLSVRSSVGPPRFSLFMFLSLMSTCAQFMGVVYVVVPRVNCSPTPRVFIVIATSLMHSRLCPPCSAPLPHISTPF